MAADILSGQLQLPRRLNSFGPCYVEGLVGGQLRSLTIDNTMDG
jgi:hypothetical protein